ncbi:MAG: PEP-CTERM sorting domain-containing protein [Armatimonadetes bacterium]|nr:PEP-CTERM sorting domain-containing protein [Armatimonadota bacterium]
MYRTVRTFFVLTLTVGLGIVALPAIAGWDVSGDFGSTNPSGAWSYGWTDDITNPAYRFNYDGEYVPDLALYPGGPGGATGAIEGWWYAFASPSILHNKTNAQWDSGWFSMRANEVAMHPGVYAPEFPLIRWTAPAAGDYLISGKFLQQVWMTSTNDVHILLNRTSIFDGLIWYDPSDPSQLIEEAPFSLLLTLAQGDKIDFTVGLGPDRDFSMGLAALQASIDVVPEPGSMMMLGGLLGSAGLALLRRKSR